jgi:hypothetical protein
LDKACFATGREEITRVVESEVRFHTELLLKPLGQLLQGPPFGEGNPKYAAEPLRAQYIEVRKSRTMTSSATSPQAISSGGLMRHLVALSPAI